jgi:hypothetical protein
MDPLLVEARKVRATTVILAGNEQHSHNIMKNLSILTQNKIKKRKEKTKKMNLILRNFTTCRPAVVNHGKPSGCSGLQFGALRPTSVGRPTSTGDMHTHTHTRTQKHP